MQMTFLSSAALARILPFAVYMFFLVLGDILTNSLGAGDEYRYLYVAKVLSVLGVLLYYRKHYSELLSHSLNFTQTVLAVFSGLLVFLLWINLDKNWMVMGASSGFDPRTDGTLDWPLVCVRIAGAALIVPVMEELFWRSFLMRWIHSQQFLEVDPAQVKITAFVVMVILFGIEHQLWFAGVVAGMVYGGLYMLSKNLWVAVMSHAVTNGVLGVWVLNTQQWTYW